MKTVSLSFFILLFSFQLFGQECLPGGITFNSQTEIDNFITTYPNCTIIEGNVNFKNDMVIDNFNGLQNIKEIKGDFFIWGGRFFNMNGLENLEKVGGNFGLSDCNILQNIEACSKLKSVGGSFRLFNCGDLRNIDPIYNLLEIGGSLLINGCSKIPEINFSDDLIIRNGILISNNQNLKLIKGFKTLNNTLENVEIRNNEILENLSVFEDLKLINGDLVIGNNPNLPDISFLSSLELIGGNFNLNKLPLTTTLAPLSNLSSVGNDFNLQEMNGLNDLSPLRSLSIIHGNFWLTNNQNILNLNGLENIESFSGRFEVSGNHSIKDLDPLKNTSFGHHIIIDNNEQLSDISALSFLNETNGILQITNNFNLTSLAGLENLTSINNGGRLRIGNAETDLYPLRNLTVNSIVFSIEIINSKNLVDLKGLEGLTGIIGNLTISGNESLESLKGLEGLEKIRNYKYITDNLILNDISALENCDLETNEPYFMSIINNPQLSQCHIESICKAMAGTIIGFRDNGTNCRSVEEVLQECLGKDSVSLDSICFPGKLELSSSYTPARFGLENPNCKEIYGDIEINAVSDLKGLENIKKIHGDLIIYHLDSSFEGLNNLKFIGGSFQSQWIDDINSFSGLSALEHIGGDLRINYADNLINFEGLDNLNYIGGDIKLSYAEKLSSFHGLENLKILKGKFTSNFTPAFENCEGLNNLQHVGNINIKSYKGLDNLRYAGSLSFSLSSRLYADVPKVDSIGYLHIRYRSNIEILNRISYLSDFTLWDSGASDLTALSRFKITGLGIIDTDVSYCNFENICNAIGLNLDENDVTIRGNRGQCETEEDAFFACKKGGRITFNTFFDQNKNGQQDANELFIGNIPIMNNTTQEIIFGTSLQDALSYLQLGTYDFSILSDNDSYWKTNGQVDFSVDLTFSNNDITLDIPMIPNQSVHDLVASIAPSRLRCGNETLFELRVRNLGTEFGTGTVWFDIDEKLTDFRSEPPIDTVSRDWANSIGWHFSDLHPGEELVYKIYIQIPLPPEILPGEILKFKSFFNPVIENGVHVNPDFVFEHQEAFRCSYDPNDKLVSPNRQIQTFEPPQFVNMTEFDENLIYTIRFQNTGNDVAFDVTIRDTLDSNIDPSSFTLLASSHYEVLNTSIENNRNLTFEFKDIFLPDSSANFDVSQGFVSYIVKSKNGLAENTPLKNTASIYFDQNPPIVTNTTESIMVTMLPTSATQMIDNQLNINVFPNPTSGKINFKGDNLQNATVTVTDLTGRRLLLEKLINTNEINLPTKVKGMLFIKIETDEGTAIKRIIKK